MVGETGFEPATPWTQTKCATKLRHSPIPFRRFRYSPLRVAHITDLPLPRQTLFQIKVSTAHKANKAKTNPTNCGNFIQLTAISRKFTKEKNFLLPFRATLLFVLINKQIKKGSTDAADFMKQYRASHLSPPYTKSIILYDRAYY